MKCKIKHQLELGINTEMEHAHLFPKYKQKKMAERIAKDHLKEDSCYYLKLMKMESKK